MYKTLISEANFRICRHIKSEYNLAIMIGVFEFIEDYLIRDLESIRAIKSTDGLGKCGFQMVMCLCSACELLGSIEKNEIKIYGGDERFKFFIENHLPEYLTSWKILYTFIRHRIAHDFITPPNIVICLKGDRSRHLGLMDDYFVIDAYVFMDDFIIAYKKLKARYSQESVYKRLLDLGYLMLINFMQKERDELNKLLYSYPYKHLDYPEEVVDNEEDQAVPSGAAFEFDKQNFTRLPDDMLERMNQQIKQTRSSNVSGSTIKNNDIKPLKE